MKYKKQSIKGYKVLNMYPVYIENVYHGHEPFKVVGIRENQVEVIEAKDRTLIYFDCNTFHTGIGAKSNGWRWFGRVSRNTDRVNKITNEIRVNCQVYLEFPMEGW